MTRTRILLIALTLSLVASAAFAQSSTTGNQRVLPTYQVTITSNVRNTTVYVDGELQRGSTPITLNLRRGTYDIRVEARGYLPWTQTIAVTSNSNRRAELLPPYATVMLGVPADYLNYDVRSPMSLISFHIDGEVRRESQIQVESGWHEISIVSGGLRFEGDVFLEAGMTYTLELILRLSMLQALQFAER